MSGTVIVTEVKETERNKEEQESDRVVAATGVGLVTGGTPGARVRGMITFVRQIRIGPLVAEHRNELQGLGWTVRLVDGFGHELGGRPDVVTPLLREFLDPVRLPG